MTVLGRDIGRRRFLQGMGVGAALLATGACESAVGLQSRIASASATPKPGGVGKLGLTTDLIPGNLFTNSNSAITTLIGLVYNTLTRYDHSGLVPRPELATGWTAAPDGMSLRLVLRQDVRFHSGRLFTSEDVKFSLQSYADPKWNGQLRSTAAAITNIDATSPYEVTLHFSHLLGNIFDLLDTMPIIDSATAKDIGTGTRFVGTGPFRFVSWRPNTDLRFVKNPDYFIPGRPYLDEVEVRIIPENSSLLSALKSSQVHFADGLGYRDVESVSKNPAISTITLTGAEQQTYVGATVTAPPLDDLRIRSAVAFALDRERIISEVFRGQGFPSCLPWPKSSPAYDAADAGRYRRDVARARSLVGEFSRPLPTIPLAYAGADVSMAAVAQIVQNNLDEVGIRVQLDPLDRAQFLKRLIGAQFTGLWTTNHSWAQLTPSTLTVSAYPFNARKNSSHFSSPDYIAAADTAWQLPEATGATAAAAYRTVSNHLLDDLFLIEIGIYWWQWVHSGVLRGIDYRRRRELDLTEAFLA